MVKLTSGSANASTANVLWIKQQKSCMAVWKGYTRANHRSLTLYTFNSLSVFLSHLRTQIFLLPLFSPLVSSSLFSQALPCLLHHLTHIDFFPLLLFTFHFLHFISHVAHSISLFSILLFLYTDWISCSYDLLSCSHRETLDFPSNVSPCLIPSLLLHQTNSYIIQHGSERRAQGPVG